MTLRHKNIKPTHPGEALRQDVLPALSISKAEFARRLQISRQHLYDILNEKKPVTVETALRLGVLLGNGAEFWINLQKAYDLWSALQKIDTSHIEPLEKAL